MTYDTKVVEVEEKSPHDDLEQVPTYSLGTHTDAHHVSGMKRNIKSRHAQMIAIGGTIGTGLFVGSGVALARGGPAILFLSYCLMSLAVYGMVTSIIEVATYLPLPGASTAYFAGRYISPSMGFALGWLYFYSFAIIVAYEITAASIVIGYWPNNIHIAVWITIMLIVIVVLNFCPVGIYAETEFWFAFIKVIMICGLLILSLILFWGGGPSGDRLGFRYWEHPAAVKAYIVGGAGGRLTSFIWTWGFSGFSFYFSPELMVFTAGEMRNPRKNLPIAARRFFYRLVVFYVLSALAVGVICNSSSPGLLSGTGNAAASPWVIAIQNAGIDVLPSIINAGILTSAWSSGNSYLYMSSRALYSLAVQNSAPKIFLRCNKLGTPIYAVGASSILALLAYLNVSAGAGNVFGWLINLTNTAGYTSWIVCCIIYMRFKKAAKLQGVKTPYTSKVQPYANYICLVVFIFLLLMNGFTVFYPGNFTATGFLTAYLGIPIFLAIYFGHRVYRRRDPWMISAEKIDLTTNVAEVEEQFEMWTIEDQEAGEKRRGWVNKLLTVLWG